MKSFGVRNDEVRRLFCAMMTSLANHDFINQYWQAPIYRNRLLLAPQKNGYVNRRDLAFANHAINNVVMDYRIERINHIVRSLFPDFVTQKIRILQLIDKQYFVSLRTLILGYAKGF